MNRLIPNLGYSDCWLGQGAVCGIESNINDFYRLFVLSLPTLKLHAKKGSLTKQNAIC